MVNPLKSLVPKLPYCKQQNAGWGPGSGANFNGLVSSTIFQASWLSGCNFYKYLFSSCMTVHE